MYKNKILLLAGFEPRSSRYLEGTLVDYLTTTQSELHKVCFYASSVTRLDNLLHFGQLFKAHGKNYFAQNAHIFSNFCKGVKMFHFSSAIILGQLL